MAPAEIVPLRRRNCFAETRRLVGGLEFLVAEGGCRDRPAVLFLHGASAAAWVWAEHLMPALAQAGWRCAAVSFRGHGGSAGRPFLHGFGLLDYLIDASAAIAALGCPVVLVGHSLGGLVAQMMLGDPRLRGLVLLAAVPPEGLAGISLGLALSDPALWREAARIPWADAVMTPPQRLRQALFSEALPESRAAALLGRFQSESLRAVTEAQLPRPVASARLVGVPALVLAARDDPLVPEAVLLRTAVLHGASYLALRSVRHAMMLDAAWPDVAEALIGWLEARYG